MSSMKQSIRYFAINQALKHIEGNPDENLPKLMDLVDRFSPDGWYVHQRSAMALRMAHKLPFGISTCYTSRNWADISSEA